MDLPLLLFLAPPFLAFEVWQLIIAERYLGLKQIQQGVDPRTRGPSEPVAFLWSAGILAYWGWMLLMLLSDFGRAQIICMLVLSLAGYALRRNLPLKWILVALTLEGAVRIGMIMSLLGVAWKKL